MMEVSFEKPLYEDFKKQAWSCIMDDRRIHSRERLYEFADRPMILSVYAELFAAFIFFFLYLPKPGVLGILIYLLVCVLVFLSVRLYMRRFVYRFARFSVMWEDWQTHPGAACEICDEYGAFLKTKENRRAARESRFTFAALFLLIAAVAITFYFVTWGAAEERVRNSGQLGEFIRIAEQQGNVSLNVDSDGVEVWSFDEGEAKYIRQKDEKWLEDIFRELQWNYVDDLDWYNGELHVHMRAGIEYKSFDVSLGQQ